MGDLTRQQLCAALAVSESTVRRLEREGLPYTPVGVRAKRYDLDECKQWLRSRGPIERSTRVSLTAAGSEYTTAFRRMKLRVYPGKP